MTIPNGWTFYAGTGRVRIVVLDSGYAAEAWWRDLLQTPGLISHAVVVPSATALHELLHRPGLAHLGPFDLLIISETCRETVGAIPDTATTRKVMGNESTGLQFGLRIVLMSPDAGPDRHRYDGKRDIEIERDQLPVRFPGLIQEIHKT